jgi:hypothetical protein
VPSNKISLLEQASSVAGSDTVSAPACTAGGNAGSRGAAESIAGRQHPMNTSPASHHSHPPRVSLSTSHATIEHHRSASGERVLCAGCRDVLFAFFSARVDSGVSPSQIGRNLWARFRLRRRSSTATALPPSPSADSSEHSVQPSPVRRLFVPDLSTAAHSPSQHSPQFPHSETASPMDSQQQEAARFPFSPSAPSDVEESHQNDRSAGPAQRLGPASSSPEIGSDGEYELRD